MSLLVFSLSKWSGDIKETLGYDSLSIFLFFFSGSTVASFVEFVHSLGMFDSIWVRDRRMCLRSRLFCTKAFSGLKLFNPVKFYFVLLYLLFVKFNESIDIFLQSVFFKGNVCFEIIVGCNIGPWILRTHRRTNRSTVHWYSNSATQEIHRQCGRHCVF